MTFKTFERPTAAVSECSLVWRTADGTVVDEATDEWRHLWAYVRGMGRRFKHLLQ